MGRLQGLISTLGRGHSKYSSPPDTGETPVVLLRVQVLSCQNLEAKDGGKSSDPFVTVSLFGKLFKTPVRQKDLNPVYTDAIFDFPIYMSLVHKLDTLEFVVWDKDMVGKDFLGQYSLPVNYWIKDTAFAFDDLNNKPFSVDLVSSPTTKIESGTMRFKVGFVHPPNSGSQPDFQSTYNALIVIGTVIVDIYGAKDLPEWKNMARAGFDMDPFVEVSIGKDVQCTRVIRHKRDPVWAEQLSFPVRQHNLSVPTNIRLAIFDRDTFTPDDYVGDVVISMASLTKEADPRRTSYPDLTIMRQVDRPLNLNQKKAYVAEGRPCTPTIKCHARYLPYVKPGEVARQG